MIQRDSITPYQRIVLRGTTIESIVFGLLGYIYHRSLRVLFTLGMAFLGGTLKFPSILGLTHIFVSILALFA